MKHFPEHHLEIGTRPKENYIFCNHFVGIHKIFEMSNFNINPIYTMLFWAFQCWGGEGGRPPPFHRILQVNAIEMKFGKHVYHVILQLFRFNFFDDVIIYFLPYDFFGMIHIQVKILHFYTITQSYFYQVSLLWEKGLIFQVK